METSVGRAHYQGAQTSHLTAHSFLLIQPKIRRWKPCDWPTTSSKLRMQTQCKYDANTVQLETSYDLHSKL